MLLISLFVSWTRPRTAMLFDCVCVPLSKGRWEGGESNPLMSLTALERDQEKESSEEWRGRGNGDEEVEREGGSGEGEGRERGLRSGARGESDDFGQRLIIRQHHKTR
jgi:hypothetical protein